MKKKAVWRKVTYKGKPIIIRLANKRSQGVSLEIKKVGSRFVAQSDEFAIQSEPGQDFDEFMRIVGGYVLDALEGSGA
ncbi:MAG: hypothetical protein DRP15_02750 [Candidatus Aenigmatarchaeota archaeon]|nr:MAG: hypothetical protein DRP15_02750 [Candidatus Aenigmarchaeota archaeon]